MALQKTWCVQLLVFMLIPLGLSMQCCNMLDPRQEFGTALCTEISTRTSKTCRWLITGESYLKEYNAVDGSVSLSESPTSANDERVLWTCSLTYKLPSSVGSYEYYVYFAENQGRSRLAFNLTIGKSMTCWNIPDVREWNAVAVCTEISNRASNTCKWDISDKSQPKGYKRVNGSVSTTSTNDLRVWGNCSVRYKMPISSGSYPYNVLFGTSQSNLRTAFTLIIVDPGKPILKNCTQSVKDGDNVRCECTTQNVGYPSPILSWRGQTTSVLYLSEIRLDKVEATYTCEMIWGNRSQTVSYSFLGKAAKGHTDGSNINYRGHTRSSSSVKVIVIVGAVVSVIAIIITVIAVFTIRKKGKENGRKRVDQQGTSSNVCPSNTNDDEVDLIENTCYVSFGFKGEGRVDITNDVCADATEPAMHGKETTQSDLYAVIGEDIERRTIQPDLYTAAEKNTDRQTTQPADVYAVVEKNKGGQPVPRDLYATVEKPKGKQQTK